MSTKVASVGLVLKNQGFIAASRNTRGQFVKDVAGMKSSVSTLDAAITKTKTTSQAAGKALSSALGGAPRAGGIFGWLRQLEAKSISTAQKIGDAFKAAFGAEGKGGKGKGPWGAGALIAYEQMKKLAEFAKDTTREVNATHEAAVQLSVNAKKGGGAYIAPGQLEAQAYATAADVKGTTADQALEAMSAFVTLTGDIKTAQSSITTFALASKASGADMKDVAESTASISKQFGIVDPKQIKDVLASMIYQGKEGAIMLPDLAKGLQKIAAAGAAFGVSKDVGGVEKLGGLVQMARGGTGSAEQAFTAVEAVFRGLTEKGKELKAQHVNVYEGRGASKHTRSIDDILIDVVSKAGGRDIGKKNAAISEIFGSEGMRAISPMIGIYQSAFAGAKPGSSDAERTAAGVAALREALGGLVHAAGSWSDVVEDAGKIQQTASSKLGASWESLKGKVSASVLPALGRLVDKFEEIDGGGDTFVTMLEESVEALTAFVGAIKPILMTLGIMKNPNATVNFDIAAKSKKEADLAAEQLAGMQMTPEQIAKLQKSNPEELEARRKKAAELQSKEYAAREIERKYATAAGEKEQVPAFVLKQAFPELYGGQQAAGAGKGGPSKVTIDGAVKLAPQQGPMRVHITGDDTKRGAGAAPPMPGTASRG